MATLTVRRRGFKRKGVSIAPTTFLIQDRGAPGRGEKLIPIQRGGMTSHAKALGLLRQGQGVTDLSNVNIKKLARSLSNTVGPLKTFRMFQAQVILRKRIRTQDGIKDRAKFRLGADTARRLL